MVVLPSPPNEELLTLSPVYWDTSITLPELVTGYFEPNSSVSLSFFFFTPQFSGGYTL